MPSKSRFHDVVLERRACKLCAAEGVFATPLGVRVPHAVDGREMFVDAGQAAVLYECDSCGDYVVTDADAETFLDDAKLNEKFPKYRLSALLRERQIRKHPPAWLRFRTPDQYLPLYGGMRIPFLRDPSVLVPVDELLSNWPRTFAERVDRVLCNMAKLGKHFGGEFDALVEDTPLLFGVNRNDGGYFFEYLADTNYIRVVGNRGRLLANGWIRVDEVERGHSSPTNPVFVAMWYGDTPQAQAEMKAVYDAINMGVRRAGYIATRADLEEHSDYIMDKVLALIRTAPLVVADFTENRNGVYYEAAFARGLGIPVIQTIKTGHLDGAHFDTKQLNHIVWNVPDDITDKIHSRILATIPLGPFPIPIA